jgi:hypothetical protein
MDRKDIQRRLNSEAEIVGALLITKQSVSDESGEAIEQEIDDRLKVISELRRLLEDDKEICG